MPKCAIKECLRNTRYENTKEIYCILHRGRITRHGYPELKQDPYILLEKLPHDFVDDFIKQHCDSMIDLEIATELRKFGYRGATRTTVGYRRRKLGSRKYLLGEIKKHRAWIRTQAIKRYGEKCELCNYGGTVDTHHVLPKKDGGPHEIDNLMVICPNCHALITRRKIVLKNRSDILKVKKRILKTLKSYYSF